MDHRAQFQQMLASPAPVLALAPMQDVTDLPFLKLLSTFGGADIYFTEYFRVHATSTLEKYILRSITENPTGRPIVAQLIGNDIPALVRTARELQQYPITAVDLNLGCPAPVVYRKCAGGGLHRVLQRDVADLDRKIYHPAASCRLNTGPSRQTRLSTRLPSTSKVRTQT